ncbi:hypothetical protein B5E60_13070 [Alistipes sp. An116]|nr:hypothetical protein B5E60_13070 [Alistipes sp. An116]
MYNALRLFFSKSISLALILLSSFTGLAFVDLKRLKTDDITQADDGTWWIHYKRQKTDTPSSVRLLDIPMKIIEKYKGQRNGDNVFNLYCRKYFLTLVTELGKVYGFPLTFHQARHNFGTHITLSLGVPIETVARMMGHMRIETTQIYAKVTDKKVEEDMKKLKDSSVNRRAFLYEEEFEEKKRKRRQLAG